MTHFLVPKLIEKVAKIVTKPYTFVGVFVFDEDLSESIPASTLLQLKNKALISTYSRPIKGDIIEYAGLFWRVLGAVHLGYKPHSREPKQVSEIYLKHVRLLSHGDDLKDEISRYLDR